MTEKPHLPNLSPGPKVALILFQVEGHPTVEVPDIINQYLRDYQREGVQFLYQHYRKNVGAILADDMGLGKTIQVIALMAAILGKTGHESDIWQNKPSFIRRMEGAVKDIPPRQPFLVIGPANVLYNWVEEINTWGYFTIGIFHGVDKTETLAKLRRGKFDVVVTTYETCRDNINELWDVDWAAVFADEVHKIKGKRAGVTVAMKRIRCPRRYGLTGTPLQNRLEELWCIMDWANPDCFAKLPAFKKNFVHLIEAGQKQEATKRQLAEARKAQRLLVKAHAPFLLRRTKRLIADQLPRKEELVVYCKPTELQIAVYRAILDTDDVKKYILSQNDMCYCASGHTNAKCHFKKNEVGISVKSLTLIYMELLRKVADHLGLLFHSSASTSVGQLEYARRICRELFEAQPSLVARLGRQGDMEREAAMSEPEQSGKMIVLKGLLSVFHNKNAKVLLFSSSTKVLDLIAAYLSGMGYRYRRLDGSTPASERSALVKEFNENPSIFIFIISTKAGGVGLNLTGANVVIVYDPNWNPTHDLQAQDRAYRLGQKRDVQVYRLISSGMIEEMVYLRQVFKQQLNSIAIDRTNARRLFKEGRGVSGGGKGQNELLGVVNLFTLSTDDQCRTEDILLRNERIEAELCGFKIRNYATPVTHTSHHSDDDDHSEVEDIVDEDLDETIQQFSDLDENSSVDSQSQMSDSDIVTGQRHRNKILTDSKSGSSSLDALFDRESQTDQDKEEDEEAAQPSHRVKISRKKQWLDLKRKKRMIKNKIALMVDKVDSDDDDEDDDGSVAKMKCSESDDELPITLMSSYDAGTKDNFQSISDVLDQRSVVHMHRNNVLIGTSRAEDHMTSCALKDVYELHKNSQLPADICQTLSYPMSDSDESPIVITKCRRQPSTATTKRKTSTAVTINSGAKVVQDKRLLIGQTPVAIRRKQFAEMASCTDSPSEEGLARRILEYSQRRRLNFLRQFYINTNPNLKTFFYELSDEALTITDVASTNAAKSTIPRAAACNSDEVSSSQVRRFKFYKGKSCAKAEVRNIRFRKLHQSSTMNSVLFTKQSRLSVPGEANAGPAQHSPGTEHLPSPNSKLHHKCNVDFKPPETENQISISSADVDNRNRNDLHARKWSVAYVSNKSYDDVGIVPKVMDCSTISQQVGGVSKTNPELVSVLDDFLRPSNRCTTRTYNSPKCRALEEKVTATDILSVAANESFLEDIIKSDTPDTHRNRLAPRRRRYAVNQPCDEDIFDIR